MFSTADRPPQPLEFDSEKKEEGEAKQIEEKSGASEGQETAEEDDKDSEEIHERFGSTTINIASDIDVESIGADKFLQVQEMDQLSNQFIIDQINVNRHQDKIFAKKPKNWPLNKPFFNEMSDDQGLIILSISVRQKKILLNSLEAYVQHVIDLNNKSLLTRIYGLYRVKKQKQSPVDLIVLKNLTKSANIDLLKYQFLLTGSLGAGAPGNPQFDKKAILEGTLSPEAKRDMVLLDGDFHELNKEKGKEGARLVHMLNKH